MSVRADCISALTFQENCLQNEVRVSTQNNVKIFPKHQVLPFETGKNQTTSVMFANIKR